MSQRIRAIDWLRGLVILLMTVDHAGSVFDAAHLSGGDNYRTWATGTPLPTGEFLTRWITHLCAPTFVLLAGASLALSTAKRGDDTGQTRFLVTRGLLIAALDPLWMSLGFNGYERPTAQVLYAIGMSMVCMAFLRRLSSTTLIIIALAIQLLGEIVTQLTVAAQPLHALWGYLWTGGPTFSVARCNYPLLPWLSIMIAGFLLGRWLLTPRRRRDQVLTLVATGLSLLVVFVTLRAINDYGNWHLYRDSLDILQWLHVNKYPPSITFTTLELGIALLLLAGFLAIDDPASPRRGLRVLSLFGATAFFYYLLHVHVLAGAQKLVLHLDRKSDGLAKTWLAALIVLVVLAGPCWLYRRYKRTHPDSWTRYI